MNDTYPDGPYNFYSDNYPDATPLLCLVAGKWAYLIDCEPPRRVSKLLEAGRLVRLEEVREAERENVEK